MKFQRVLIVAFVVLNMACTKTGTQTVAPVSTGKITNTAPTLLPSLTATLPPTKTPTPTSQPTETVPVATLNAVSTVEAIQSRLISQFPELEAYQSYCRSGYCSDVELSPNGKWIYFSNDNAIEVLESTGERVGKYSFHEIYGQSHGYSPEFLEGYMDGVHWSKDGRYLYITTQHGDGGPGPYFGYKSSLVRVNLQNGTWKDTGISGVLSFAPNEKYIVYSSNRNEVRVRNFQSGEEQIFGTPDPYWYFGEFVWSPLGKKIIFVATSESLDEPYGKFALCMIDLEQGRIILLHEGFMPFYYPVEWVEENMVSLHKYEEDELWTLDLSEDPVTIKP